jgi:hypothetical protein
MHFVRAVPSSGQMGARLTDISIDEDPTAAYFNSSGRLPELRWIDRIFYSGSGRTLRLIAPRLTGFVNLQIGRAHMNYCL